MRVHCACTNSLEPNKNCCWLAAHLSHTRALARTKPRNWIARASKPKAVQTRNAVSIVWVLRRPKCRFELILLAITASITWEMICDYCCDSYWLVSWALFVCRRNKMIKWSDPTRACVGLDAFNNITKRTTFSFVFEFSNGQKWRPNVEIESRYVQWSPNATYIISATEKSSCQTDPSIWRQWQRNRLALGYMKTYTYTRCALHQN